MQYWKGSSAACSTGNGAAYTTGGVTCSRAILQLYAVHSTFVEPQDPI